MINVLTWLSKLRFPYEPLITVEISRKRLFHNLNEFRKLAPEGRVAPVLKSNAYGHGLTEVASILKQEKNTPFLVVDSYFEAVALHSMNIRIPILIIGFTRPETIIRSRLPQVVFTITSLDQLKELVALHSRAIIHLKIDTGMHRQGILPEEIAAAISILKDNPQIQIKGICTHFADASDSDTTSVKKQIATWNDLAKKFEQSFPSIEFIHASATDGHRFTEDIVSNVSRLGIGLYGLADGSMFTPKLNLLPVLEMKTIITGVKKLQKDQTIGYDNTFTAPEDMTVATIPCGYFEGIDRRLSNNGSILIGEQRSRCPIVGRVSMNITSVDVSTISDVKIGTPVTVISRNPTDSNSITGMSKAAGTIDYDITVHIPGQLKRVIVD